MADTNLQINFKTIADLTGIESINHSIQGLQSTIESFAATANRALSVLGAGISISALNQAGDAALKNREAFAAWEVQILSSKEGAAALVDELNTFNKTLETTTGTSAITSRAIESQLALYNATGEQIKGLTKGIIELNAARPQMGIQAITNFISRAIAGQDVMLTRLGIHLDKTKSQAEQIQQLIDQLNRSGGGNLAEITHEMSAGMDEAKLAAEQAKLSFGNLINVVRVPFLTQFIQQMLGVKDATDTASLAQSKFAQNLAVVAAVIGNTLGNVLNVVKAIGAALEAMLALVAQLVVAAVALAVNGVTQLVLKSIDVITGLAKFANATALTLSFGTVGIDPAKIDAAANAAKSSIAGMADSIKGNIRSASDVIAADFQLALKGLQKTLDDMSKSGKILDPQFLKQARDQIKALFADLTKGAGIQPGTGTIQNLAGDKTGADAAKAATDALTNSKYALAAAQEKYRIEIEHTKALEESGAITPDQAEERHRAAIQATLAEYQKIQATLPGVIAQMERVGNVKGANQARLEVLQLRLETEKLNADLAKGTLRGELLSWVNSFGTTAHQIADAIKTTIGTAIQGVSSALTGLIFHTKNWGQAFLQAGQSIVQSLIQIGLQMLAQKLLGSLLKSEEVGESAGAGAAITTAYAPAAAAVNVATFGSAAATGLPITLAAISAIMAALGAGFEIGGFTGGLPGAIAGLVHGQEFVFSAPTTAFYGVDFLDRMQRSAITRPAYAQGGFVGSSAAHALGGSGSGDVHVYNFTDPDAMVRHMASTKGRKIIVDTVRGRRIDLGIHG